MPKDMDQARKMLNMRIKVDVWSKGLDENFREGIRNNVKDLFCQLPVRRVWYYLKLVQYMRLKGSGAGGAGSPEFGGANSPEGPEDMIAKGRTPHHLFTHKRARN